MKLFSPIKIGKLEIKNRIVMPSMDTEFGSEEGEVTERVIAYYEERAKGGAGLINVEYTAIERRGRASPYQLMINDDKFIPGFKRLVEAVKKHGARAGMQLHHGGVRSSAKVTQMQPVGPGDFPFYPAGKEPGPRVLTASEIHGLVLAFGEGARRAKEAGFDIIELHCTHSYLIDQFISPRFNRRTDAYGGSIENRARFPCEIIECMKDRVGGDYPIICRMTGDDYADGGITPEDAKLTAALLVKAGADCLHISVGSSGSMVPGPPMYLPDGCFLHLSEAVKKAVNVPVIGVGKIGTPQIAEQALNEGKADLVAMGRALIADPYLPKKAKEGRVEEIVPCIYCNQGCITRVSAGLDMKCVVNPAVGQEKVAPVFPAKSPKKVFIVGAGPAGLEAAVVAKTMGHEVVLAERENLLGGQLNLACKPPKKEVIQKLIDYFAFQVKKLGIKTYLGKSVTKEFLQEINPDVVILATGSTPAVPDLPGVHGENVSSAIEVLKGKKVSGRKVIVVGGGQVGLETADLMAEGGKEVLLLEMLSEVGADMAPRNKTFLMRKLSDQKVQIFVNRKGTQISKNGVLAAHFGQKEEFTGDAVILAVGSNPDRSLLQELEGIITELQECYMAGDCIQPRKALEAIHEGARIAGEIH